MQIFNANNEIKIIGTRHSEKLYETLLTQEEMQNAIDMGQYYRIPADNRNLNYDQYVSEGEVSPENLEDYHSHNTERLENDELIKVLLGLDFVQQELKNNA